VRGPFPSRASLLSHSPLKGCSFVAPPISASKYLARDMRGFFNSLLGGEDREKGWMLIKNVATLLLDSENADFL
jgi:hypothetical protein